jgi:hypothetical protein
MNKSRKYALVALFIFVVLFGYFTWQYNIRLNRLNRDGNWTIGYITSYEERESKYPGVTIYYKYTVNGIEYTG